MPFETKDGTILLPVKSLGVLCDGKVAEDVPAELNAFNKQWTREEQERTYERMFGPNIEFKTDSGILAFANPENLLRISTEEYRLYKTLYEMSRYSMRFAEMPSSHLLVINAAIHFAKDYDGSWTNEEELLHAMHERVDCLFEV